MAAATVESSMSLSEPEEGCLLVRTSLDKYLCFMSTSDYLQYLISHVSSPYWRCFAICSGLCACVCRETMVPGLVWSRADLQARGCS